jgi:hypothetical protein
VSRHIVHIISQGNAWPAKGPTAGGPVQSKETWIGTRYGHRCNLAEGNAEQRPGSIPGICSSLPETLDIPTCIPRQ